METLLTLQKHSAYLPQRHFVSSACFFGIEKVGYVDEGGVAFTVEAVETGDARDICTRCMMKMDHMTVLDSA